MYMLYQQYTTAIRQRYAGSLEVTRHASAAKACREWLESLDIDPRLRIGLVEQVRTLEEAFADLADE